MAPAVQAECPAQVVSEARLVAREAAAQLAVAARVGKAVPPEAQAAHDSAMLCGRRQLCDDGATLPPFRFLNPRFDAGHNIGQRLVTLHCFQK